MTQKSGVPLFVEQEGAKSIATGIENTKNWEDIRIADIDGFVWFFQRHLNSTDAGFLRKRRKSRLLVYRT